LSIGFFAINRFSALPQGNHAAPITAQQTVSQEHTNGTATSAAATHQAIDAYTQGVGANGIMVGFNAQHTGDNSYEQMLNTDNVRNLVPAWSDSVKDSALSVVAYGLVYVVGYNEGPVGGSGSIIPELRALDAITGAQKWATPLLKSSSTADLAVANGLVYLDSQQGQVSAWDALSGKQRWAWSAPGNEDYASWTTIAQGFAYVFIEIVPHSDGKLYVLNAATGKQQWTWSLGPSHNPAGSFSWPAVTPNVVYVSAQGQLFALDATSHKQKWVWDDPSHFSLSAAVVTTTLIYVSDEEDGRLYALNPATGTQKWFFSAGPFYNALPAVANGVIYFCAEDPKTRLSALFALDARTGQKEWMTPVDGVVVDIAAGYAAASSTPTIADGVIYVGAESSGQTYAFDARTGIQKWTAPTGGGAVGGWSAVAAPLVANGMVYFTDADRGGQKRLYAFHLKS
jgi:outer membrane protein assembly factor BamB